MDDAGFQLMGVGPDPVEIIQYHRKTEAQLWESAPLALAVLKDAIDAYLMRMRKSRVNHSLLQRDAERWLFSENLDHPFSFINVCDRLGLNPSYLRRGLRNLREDQGFQASDSIFDRLSPYASQLTPHDVERAVTEAFQIPCMMGRSRARYLARYTHFRIEYNVLKIPTAELEREWRSRGLKDLQAFTKTALTRPIPKERCEVVVQLLIARTEAAMPSK